jgi:phage gpG-like protein
VARRLVVDAAEGPGCLMAEPRIDIEQRGVEHAAWDVNQIGERAANPRPFFRVVHEQIAQAEGNWFATQGRGSWPELSAATRERKARAGLDNGTLVATGRLRNSLTKSSGRGARRRATKTTMRFGTTVPYARYFYKKMPPLVPMDERMRRDLCKRLSTYLVKSHARSSGL